MTVIYRVENAAGQEPYKSFTVGWCGYGTSEDNLWISTTHNDPHHPPPSEDGLGFIKGGDRCGFRDIQQLEAWFTDDELVKMFDNGFRIVELNVEHVAYGGRQVTFSGVKSSQVFL